MGIIFARARFPAAADDGRADARDGAGAAAARRRAGADVGRVVPRESRPRGFADVGRRDTSTRVILARACAASSAFGAVRRVNADSL